MYFLIPLPPSVFSLNSTSLNVGVISHWAFIQANVNLLINLDGSKRLTDSLETAKKKYCQHLAILVKVKNLRHKYSVLGTERNSEYGEIRHFPIVTVFAISHWGGRGCLGRVPHPPIFCSLLKIR